MFYAFLFLQFDWQKLRPENLFGGQVLERTPAGLSIVYLIGMAVLILFLMLSLFRNFRRPKFAFEENLPKEVKRKLSSTLTNRSLRIWQIVFILLAFSVFGFHVYWTYYADKDNEQFQALSYKDLRNRRTSASQLARLDARPFRQTWQRARLLQTSSKTATSTRTFALEKEMAHLLGTERGTPGLERTLYKQDSRPDARSVGNSDPHQEDRKTSSATFASRLTAICRLF